MKNNKLGFCTISLLLILSLSMFFQIQPTESAVTERQFTLFIAAGPPTIGIGQSTAIVAWANVNPSTYLAANNSAGPGLARLPRYHDYVVTITDPDGVNETRAFPETDSLGAVSFSYTPEKLGNYTISCYYPGESFENSQFFKADVAFKAAQSRVATFVVQQEPLHDWVETPLPTEYWTRPIDASNQVWASQTGNWLRMGMGSSSQNRFWTNFQPYGTAPNTAHILWANVFENGGLVGGEVGESGYYTGESYQSKFTPIVLNGKLYTNTRVGPATFAGYVCYDLATGKELFRRSDYTLTSAFSFSHHWENAHGTIDFLIQRTGTNLNFYDPRNGENVFNITNVPTGGGMITNVTAEGITNDLYIYNLAGGNLTKWSFYETVKPAAGQINWAPSRTTPYNGTVGMIYNVAIPRPHNEAGQYLSGDYTFGTNGGECDGTWIIGRSVNTTTSPPTVYLVGIRAADGEVMWETNHQLIEDPGIWRGGGGTHLDSANGVYLNYKKETMQTLAIDINNNGQVKYYTPPRNASDWGSYTSGWCMDSAYGILFVGAYDGYMMAYNLTNGNLMWQYYAGDSGLVTSYGTYPFFLGIYMGMGIADGKVFAPTGEHSGNDPLYRGERMHVINATTGDAVWTIQGWWLDFAIADGQYTAFNGYDGRIYSFGKGPSAMTTTASPKVSTGGNVLIEGTITDISAGTGQTELAARFPNGVPVVSDESMTSWMEYVYMDQSRPANATGVKVLIDVLDSNNNYRNIGEATSDTNGHYSFEWTPDITGVFTVYARFEGSESYWPSHAETAFAVDESAATPTTGLPESGAPTELYFAISTIAIIVAIAIVGAILALMLKKRP
jgi:hypothetical protein